MATVQGHGSLNTRLSAHDSSTLATKGTTYSSSWGGGNMLGGEGGEVHERSERKILGGLEVVMSATQYLAFGGEARGFWGRSFPPARDYSRI